MEDGARMEAAQQFRQSQRKFPVIRSPEHRVTAIRDSEISKASSGPRGVYPAYALSRTCSASNRLLERFAPSAIERNFPDRRARARCVFALQQNPVERGRIAMMSERDHGNHLDIVWQRERLPERVRVETSHLMGQQTERMRLKHQRHRRGARIVQSYAVHFAL